ncbi:MAG: threonylcarbamoyl-AMP synthase [Anaerolineae bacterium CG_4_9_14_3_um_filter_57_17]|nr:threonylcarbamoyl-AMP synthase [bacterium]NCT20182.1 threonylcarbamoyl-AMP synthase [bacterium]OIO83582.1 MAG: threonylcarbamoyl-AMP synthase [Anaerolineae bacterium CG2_30_57_67]PJB66753.1 MAG: threonylcarbamoyl-AMP synthase [Anaerolineae bacterium CG_4_9_14_3_um_filter_57_17]
MKTEILFINDPDALALAIDVLTNNGLVAFPTDTVYGLGALVFNELAVSEIYTVKERGSEKAVPVLVGDFEQLERVAHGVSSICAKLARRFWPGPLTIVLPRHPNIPEAVTPYPTVGVRIPDFEPTRELLRLTGPLAVSSANRSGNAAPCTARGVEAELGGRIPLILDGGVTPGGMPSTVVDCSQGEPKILRAGPITLEQILNALS